MVAGGRIGVVQIPRELPEQITPVFVERLRLSGNLDDVFAVAANIANRDKADAFSGLDSSSSPMTLCLLSSLRNPTFRRVMKSLSDG